MRSSERIADQQLGPVDRLGEEVVGARVERRLVRPEIAERRQEEDRRVAAAGQRADAAAGLEAVHARHDDVEQHQVGAPLLEAGQPALAAVGQDGAVAGRQQVPLGDLAVLEVVVDDQDGLARDSADTANLRRRRGGRRRPQVGLDRRAEGARVDRLAEIALKAAAQQALAIAGHGQRGHGDDRQIDQLGALAHLAITASPPPPGIVHVQQQQIEALVIEHQARLVDVGGLDHLVTAQLEDVVQQQAIERVVLDDQDAGPNRLAVPGPLRLVVRRHSCAPPVPAGATLRSADDRWNLRRRLPHRIRRRSSR